MSLAAIMCLCLAADAPERDAAFAEKLSQVEFVGSFTLIGSERNLKSESYAIRKVEKLPQADLFRFVARIKYGETDVELPMDLPVLWSGNTPVITLDNVWLPGLGTFSARVLVHEDRYAGTWQHDEKGGHLFGIIKKGIKPEKSPDPGSLSPGKSEENKP
jgi:hypothetical protein